MSGLPIGWADARLEDLADEVTGSIAPDPSRRYELYSVPAFPLGSPENVGGAVIGSNKRPVAADDVLLCKINPRINRVWFVGPFNGRAQVASTEFIPLRLPSGNETTARYLMWYLRSPKFRAWIKLNTEGATGSHTRAKSPAILRQFVPIAPLNEQKRIVAAIEEQFSRLDAGSAALARVRTNLKRVRAAVLEAAVTGRLDTRRPADGSGQDLLSRISLPPARPRSKHRHNELVTDLPNLPSTWAAARWSSIGRSQNGRAFPSSDYSHTGTKLLRPGNLDESGQIEWTAENTRFLPEHYAEEFPEYLIPPNEIVMNLTAQSLKDQFLGRVCMTGTGDQVLLNQRIAWLTPRGMNSRFIFWVFKSPLFRRFVSQLNTGSLIQHMFTSQVDEFQLPIPPMREQDRIVQQVERVMTAIDIVERAAYDTVERQTQMRSHILGAAFSGKLVPQHPEDEPAATLLGLVAAERGTSNGHKETRINGPGITPPKVST